MADLPADPTALLEHFRALLAERLPPRPPAKGVTILGAGEGPETVKAGREHVARMSDGGWSTPLWPAEHGGAGLSAHQVTVFNEALADFDVPDLYPFAIGLHMAGPVIYTYGTDAQKARWLEDIRTGRQVWCQMFSEPDAGSDLASLATRAERDGDEWVLHGQKVWTSRAHYSEWGFCLARTDPSVPKHRGITAFALSMDSPGLTLVPLRQINRDEHFNEVFLDGVRVPDDQRLGGVGDGWKVAMTTLAHERAAAGRGMSDVGVSTIVDLLVESGRRLDPVARQRAARMVVELEVMRLTDLRARQASLRGGEPGPEGSGGKLRRSSVYKAVADLALWLRGPAGVAGAGAEADDPWNLFFLTSPSLSIRGGTDEIQRNIVAERVLGLPGEPRTDRDQPFSASRGGAAAGRTRAG
jgi:acyl-CoA dehydrogenase